MKQQVKKLPDASKKTLWNLTIANIVFGFITVAFLAFTIYVFIYLKQQENITSQIVGISHKKLLSYIALPTFGLAFVSLALAIAQSVLAKRIGKISEKINATQIICILIIFIGLATLIGTASSCILYLRGRISSKTRDLIWNFGSYVVAFGALLMLGATIYNIVLCTKIPLKKK